MKKVLLTASLLGAVLFSAQVGINTEDPEATFDVNGNVRIQSTASTPVPSNSDCPCFLVVDKNGELKRVPMSQGSGVGTGSGTGSGGTGSGSSTGTGANLGTIANANFNSVSDYVSSLTHNGATYQGKINSTDHKVIVKIPYTNGNGKSYNEGVYTTTTSAESSANGTSPITMRVLEGTLNSGNGYFTAEITTPSDFDVKLLPAGEVKKIADFKFTLNGLIRTVTLNAIGGIPDKNFSDADHKFVYAPVTVKIGNYEKIWLSQNLGSDYANINKKGVFNPTKLGGDSKTDYHAYGSLFQWGREADGHELMNWTSSNSGTPVKSNIPWRSSTELTTFNDPCPKGYHTPSSAELLAFHKAVTGSDASDRAGNVWKDKALNLSPAGYREVYASVNLRRAGSNGYYWSGSTNNTYDALFLDFAETSSTPTNRYDRASAYSVRCIKDN